MLPVYIEKFIPKIYRRDAGLTALADKADTHIADWKADVLKIATLIDPARIPNNLLVEVGELLSAGIGTEDSDRIKREKIANAVPGHKKRGQWVGDVKPKIDAIVGGDAELFPVVGQDDFILVGDGNTLSTYFWSILGGDGTATDYGIRLVGEGDENTLKGVILIDTDGPTPVSIPDDGIFQAFTNLVQDPTDLRAAGANWTSVNTTDELTDIEINGHKFTKIINSGANPGYNQQALTDTFTNLILTGRVTIKKGSSSGNTTRFRVYNNTDPLGLFYINIDFDNYPSAPTAPIEGTLLDYEWIDSETLSLNIKCVALTDLTDDIQIRCYGSNNATADEYTYWTEVQLIDEADITMFPFVDGTHAADVIDETFTMPDKFVMDIILEPKFAYDVATNKRIFSWYIDATHRFSSVYAAGSDNFLLQWQDGGTSRTLSSQTFDDGSVLVDINQRLRLICFLDPISGGINDSMFIVIPLESGSINIDNTFSGVPDIKSSDFPTLSIGHENNIRQADSEYESFHIYSWDGTKPTITSSDDVDDYFADKEILLDSTHSEDIIEQIKLSIKDSVPAYCIIKLGYTNGGPFIMYPNGQIG